MNLVAFLLELINTFLEKYMLSIFNWLNLIKVRFYIILFIFFIHKYFLFNFSYISSDNSQVLSPLNLEILKIL